MINTEVTSNKPKINWSLRLMLFLVLMQLTSMFSMAINDPNEVDSIIKTKINSMLGIENLGNLQSIQTTSMGPLTFYQLNFFQLHGYQVSAKATPLLAFNPKITCVSGSKSLRC